MAYGTTNVDNIQSSTAGTPVVFKDGGGTQIGTLCRAWVNFTGTGTVAISGSFNVSSITDNGAGDYTVNYTTALADANYSISGSCYRTNAANIFCVAQTAPTASACRINTLNVSLANTDMTNVYVAIHR
jgi:hypothetical protein